MMEMDLVRWSGRVVVVGGRLWVVVAGEEKESDRFLGVGGQCMGKGSSGEIRVVGIVLENWRHAMGNFWMETLLHEKVRRRDHGRR